MIMSSLFAKFFLFFSVNDGVTCALAAGPYTPGVGYAAERIGDGCARCNKCVTLAHIEKYQKNLIYFSETP